MPSALALRAAGIGDLLTVVPALRALRRTHHVRLATTPTLLDFARWLRVADDVQPVATLDDPPAPPADLAVNLHGSGPESHRWLLRSGSEALLSFRNPSVPASVRGPRWDADEHEVHRWCRLLTTAGIEADPDDLDLEPETAVVPLGDRIVVHVGAGSAARRWPIDRWDVVVRALGSDVVLTGDERDRPEALELAERAGIDPHAVVAGSTSLIELAAIVGRASLLLAGDTGVGHLATAFGRPSVLLFGPTPPAIWGPPPERRRHVALWHGATGDPHGHTPHTGLLSITPGEVLDAADRARAAGPRERAA